MSVMNAEEPLPLCWFQYEGRKEAFMTKVRKEFVCRRCGHLLKKQSQLSCKWCKTLVKELKKWVELDAVSSTIFLTDFTRRAKHFYHTGVWIDSNHETMEGGP